MSTVVIPAIIDFDPQQAIRDALAVVPPREHLRIWIAHDNGPDDFLIEEDPATALSTDKKFENQFPGEFEGEDWVISINATASDVFLGDVALAIRFGWTLDRATATEAWLSRPSPGTAGGAS